MYSDAVSDEYARQLFDKFCQGDQRAGIELVNLYGDRLFQYIRRSCIYNDREEAEECLQNTWEKLLQYCGKPLRAGGLWRFMCAVAKNQSIDDFRARSRQKRSPADKLEYLEEYHYKEMTSSSASPEQVLELLEEELDSESRLHAFKLAMAALPDKQRLAMTLKLAGYALKDIARQMGEKDETVKSHIRYAKKRLEGILVS
jgi:RNA polymerase sigma-70 factor (ECF subfamily)